MKKKVLTVLLAGAMAASMAAGATVVSAADDDNTLTIWAWDQNFNIKSMQIAADQYAADHEGFSVDIIETSSDDCQTKLTTAANAGDYSTLPDIVLMQDNSYQKFLKAYPDAFTDLKDMNVNWDDFGALKQSYSMVDDTHYGVPFDNGAVIACYRTDILEEAGYTLDDLTDITWSKFEEYCKKLTVDADGDGKTDQYALASFSKYYLPMCAANNNATFVSRDKDGSYQNATGSKEFLEAMNWGMSLMDKGYIMPKPDGAAWDWYKAAFRDGEVAMQTAEVYEISAFASMEDDWGFVMFPYNEKNKGATNKTTPNDNIVVMPSCFSAEEAEKIAFAYDLYTEATPGYDLDDAWKQTYYDQFRDDRAVDETLTMMHEQEHIQTSYLPLINDLDYGDFCYAVYAGATTPAKKIEAISSKWDSKISDMNKKYANFAASHSK